MNEHILISRSHNIYNRKKLLNPIAFKRFNRIYVIIYPSYPSLDDLCKSIKCITCETSGKRQLPYSTLFRTDILPNISPSTEITFLGNDVIDYYFYRNCLLYCDTKLKKNIKYYDITNWPDGNPENNRNTYHITDNRRINCIPKWLKKTYKIYSLCDKLTDDFVKYIGGTVTDMNDYKIVNFKSTTVLIGKFNTSTTTSIKCNVKLLLNSETDVETCFRFYQLRDGTPYSKRAIENYYIRVISSEKILNYIIFFPNRKNKLEKLFMMELY